PPSRAERDARQCHLLPAGLRGADPAVRRLRLQHPPAPPRPRAPPRRAAALAVIHPWKDLAPGPHPPESVTAVIEIPQGARNKYELDKDSGLFRLDRVLYSAVHYPGD